MCVVLRPIVYSLIMGMLGCLANSAYAQHDPQTANPFGADSKTKGKEVEPTVSNAPRSLQPAAAPDEGNTARENPSLAVPIEESHSLSLARIRKALEQPAAVDFVDTPLSEVVDFLVDTTKIPIIIDKRALDDVGLGSDTPVTMSLQGISLRSTLRLMLSELDLTYTVRDEVLKITTPEEAENEQETRLYAVADLAHDGKPPLVVTRAVSRFDLLGHVIHSMVAPDSWDEVGGAGSFVPHDPWGFVAISQTDRLHEKIDALLATIARARRTDPQRPGAAVAFPVLRDAELNARGRFEQALTVEATLEFNDAPLSEVVAFLKDQFGIPIIIDRRALDDVGMGSDTPVTVSLHGITLRSALHLVLKELDLTSMITDGVLRITTPEAAENELLICVYPIQDLLDTTGLSPAGGPSENASSLIDVIHATIAPDTWDEVGGAGDVLPAGPWGLLIVSQTEAVHDQIRGLLTAARRVRTSTGSKKPAVRNRDARVGVSEGNPFSDRTTSPGYDPFSSGAYPGAAADGIPPALLLKVYELKDAGLVEQVSRLITGTIQGAPWNQAPWNQAATIFPVGNKLLIRQTREAHQQIDELLRAIGAVNLHGMAGQGMMGGGMGGGSGFF